MDTGHHLILGVLKDYITGCELPDTHDERYRQHIARFLVTERGFQKQDITPRVVLTVAAGARQASIRVDFTIRVNDRICMVVQYGPGSIVTRHRSVIAISRLVAPYQVPFAVATNGETADVLDGASGRLLSRGFDMIPSKSGISDRIATLAFEGMSDKRVEMEGRLLFAYEVDDKCPCDDTVACER